MWNLEEGKCMNGGKKEEKGKEVDKDDDNNDNAKEKKWKSM